MNKIFSVVWSYSLSGWVVTSELAQKTSKSGPCKGIKTLVAVAVGLSFGLVSTLALAGTAMQRGVVSDTSALGTGSSAAATVDGFSIAIGGGTGATARNRAVAIGEAANATGDSSSAYGRLANATGTDSVAIGLSSNAQGFDAIAIGRLAVVSAAANQALALGTGANASNSGAVALGSNSTTAAAVGTSGATIGGVAYTFAGTTPASVVSVGSVGAERQITNVAAGQISATSTDAVNGSQLNATNQQVTTNSTAITNIQNGTEGMFQVKNTSALPNPAATGTDTVAGGGGAQASGNNSTAVGSNAIASAENTVAVGHGATATGTNSVALGVNSTATRDNSVSVGAPGSERQITHVAAATQGTDAVNFDQLNSATANTTNNANTYTDQRFSQLKSDLNKQDRVLSAGIAGAMAMASLPQPYVAGASMTAIAAATYRGQQGLSLGVSRVSDNGHWVGKLQASTTTQSYLGVGVGVGYQW